MGSDRPLLRAISAAYPGPSHPRRGHFIENLHRHLNDRFRVEVLAPRVFDGDPLEEQRHGMPVTRFPYPSGNRLPKAAGISALAAFRYLRSAHARAAHLWPVGDARRGGAVLAVYAPAVHTLHLHAAHRAASRGLGRARLAGGGRGAARGQRLKRGGRGFRGSPPGCFHVCVESSVAWTLDHPARRPP